MLKLNACDYSYPAQGVAIDVFARQLATAGITVVQRYLFDGGKGITTAERTALLAAGIGIVYGYEGFASNWRGGQPRGEADGQDAVACLQRLGVKPSRRLVVMMAIDEDAAGLGMLPVAKAYVNAARKVLRKAGYGGAAPYGSNKVLDYCRRYGFQTYAWSGDGHGGVTLSKRTALFQWLNGQRLAGAEVDYGEVINPKRLGAEWPAGADPRQVKEPHVAMFNVRLMRAVIFGGKYATAALRNRYPKLARGEGLRDEVDAHAKAISELKSALALLEKPAGHKPTEHKP